MAWTDLLVSKKAIEALFGESPSLSQAEIHEVRFHRDGPSVFIRFKISQFPNNPPLKWIANKFNCVQLVLQFIEVRECQMNGWSLNPVGELHLQKELDGVRLRFSVDNVLIDLCAGVVELVDLLPYCEFKSGQENI